MRGLIGTQLSAPGGGTSGRREVVATIHPFAGLGHQLSGMIAAELWARDLGLALRPTRLPADPTGVFFRESASTASRRRRLVITRDERDATSVEILRAQIVRHEHDRRRTLQFVFALDQPRWDQTPASEWLRANVLGGPLGPQLLQAEAAPPYIAIHIRRSWFEGDISESTHANRWIGNDWYVRHISALRNVHQLASLPIRVYSLGDAASFSSISSLANVELHLNGEQNNDLIELAAARVLVAAPSSFSFSAALISKGAVLARYPWWHHIPSEGRWVRIGADSRFSLDDMGRALLSTERFS